MPDSETGLVADNHKHIVEKDSETGEIDLLCGCSTETRTVLVSIKVLDNQVDLFDREFRDNDSK